MDLRDPSKPQALLDKSKGGRGGPLRQQSRNATQMGTTHHVFSVLWECMLHVGSAGSILKPFPCLCKNKWLLQISSLFSHLLLLFLLLHTTHISLLSSFVAPILVSRTLPSRSLEACGVGFAAGMWCSFESSGSSHKALAFA